MDWAVTAEDDQALSDWVRTLIKLRSEQAVFRRRRFFRGKPLRGGRNRLGDIEWFTLAGEEMNLEEMTGGEPDAGFVKSLTVFLNGRAISEPDRGASGSPMTPSCWCSTPARKTSSSPSRRAATDPLVQGAGHRQRVTEPADDNPVQPRDTITLINHSLQLLRRG